VSAPLHERIRAGIEARILSGALPPGARLPTEAGLMAEHRCSRMTVNKALSALAAAGLIERRKRAGSFVARPRVHAMMLDIPDLESEIAARGGGYGFRLLARAARKARTAEERALAGDGRVLAIEGVHLADGRPIAFERRAISLAAVPAAEGADLAAVSPGKWLLEHVPWTEAETRLSAVPLDPATARHLALDPGHACLLVERRTWRGSDGVTAVAQTFDGATYDLTARFGPKTR